MKIRSIPAKSPANQALSDSINRFIKYLKLNEKIIEAKGEIFLIFAEHPKENDEDIKYSGLDIVLEMDSIDIPIIIISIFDENFYLSNNETKEKFKAVMGRERVGFLPIENYPETLLEKYKEIMEKKEDPLALEIYHKHLINESLGRINHGYERFLGKDKKKTQEAISRARELGLKGNDERIIKIIRDYRNDPLLKHFFGKFNGIFVDIEGTLLIDGRINERLVRYLRSLEKEKPITIWTGGEIQSFIPTLKRNNIPWRVMSKYHFSGCEVEIAIDDISEETLKRRYGISARKYLNVRDV